MFTCNSFKLLDNKRIEYGHHSTYQHTNTPTTTLTNHGVRLSMELGLFQPIEFDTSTQPLCFGYDQALFQVIRVGAFAIL